MRGLYCLVLVVMSQTATALTGFEKESVRRGLMRAEIRAEASLKQSRVTGDGDGDGGGGPAITTIAGDGDGRGGKGGGDFNEDGAGDGDGDGDNNEDTGPNVGDVGGGGGTPTTGTANPDDDDNDDVPLHIHFCGSALTTGVGSGGANRTIFRPEDLHSEKCSPSGGCVQCDDRSKCWHGSGAGNQNLGDCHLAIEAQPSDTNSGQNNYSANIWAKCGDGGGTWKVYVHYLENGILSIYEDKDLKKTFNEDSDGGEVVSIDLGTDTKISAYLKPKNASNVAKAKIDIFGINVDPAIEACMGTKLCLGKLEPGNANAYKIRNNNDKQLTCLSGDLLQSDALYTTCEGWRTCLQDQGTSEADMIDILTAALSASASTSLTEGNSVVDVTGDAEGCINPATADAEAFKCDCLDGFKTKCESETDTQGCYRDIMCDHSQICASWKTTDRCGSNLMERSSKITRAAASKAISLDDTTVGKCGG